MQVLGNDVQEVDPEFVAATGLELVPFDELLARSDFVSLNCDLNETSHHLISTDALEAMKPSAPSQ